ncbi:hypothetical protein ELQ35_10335 [Peribacillus cavernae]|uniref:Uncharacterized protein n=1 Tax=Peribacillus cavernae TaxID=1674310 RepID=A0A433HMK0_9BACI|nr:hypothetical protein [Peribacillus cavernae]MDQ0218937.1 RNase P subunit RPR2 [Peribacillus cavernae]RUQ29352.1 hypothetical protein ELQ35_10335 [Peribacillus cavernae]
MREGNKITGTLKCKECGKVNEWYYITADNSNSGKDNTFIIDTTKAAATRTKGRREQPEEFRIYCKGCDRTIFFEYNEKE